jgi:hypothetical protein
MNTPAKKSVEPNESGGFWEARVSEALNVPRKTLAKLRGEHLTAVADFRRAENNAVVLTLEGMAKIEALLATPSPTAVSGLPTIAAKETGGKPPAKGQFQRCAGGPSDARNYDRRGSRKTPGCSSASRKSGAVLTAVRCATTRTSKRKC